MAASFKFENTYSHAIWSDPESLSSRATIPSAASSRSSSTRSGAKQWAEPNEAIEQTSSHVIWSDHESLFSQATSLSAGSPRTGSMGSNEKPWAESKQERPFRAKFNRPNRHKVWESSSSSSESSAKSTDSAWPEPPGVPSVGSLWHDEGLCRPCKFWFKGLCRYDFECQSCHHVHPGQKRQRLRMSKRQRDKMKARAAEEAAARGAGQQSHEGTDCETPQKPHRIWL